MIWPSQGNCMHGKPDCLVQNLVPLPLSRLEAEIEESRRKSPIIITRWCSTRKKMIT